MEIRKEVAKSFKIITMSMKEGKNNHTDRAKQSKNSGKNLRMMDLKTYSFSNGHILKGIRPLSTFQSKHAYMLSRCQLRSI